MPLVPAFHDIAMDDLLDHAYNVAQRDSRPKGNINPPRISASIGISLFPKDGATREELYAHADEAMYHVKRSGKNDYLFYGDIPTHRKNKIR